eukprot:4071102-Amphidinium_carterae.1
MEEQLEPRWHMQDKTRASLMQHLRHFPFQISLYTESIRPWTIYTDGFASYKWLDESPLCDHRNVIHAVGDFAKTSPEGWRVMHAWSKQQGLIAMPWFGSSCCISLSTYLHKCSGRSLFVGQAVSSLLPCCTSNQGHSFHNNKC